MDSDEIILSFTPQNKMKDAPTSSFLTAEKTKVFNHSLTAEREYYGIQQKKKI